jgi:tetratricopeptide (TPR) repeat protein
VSRKARSLALALLLVLWPGGAIAQDCAAPGPVCAALGAVFMVSSYDPAASAVRIGPDLLVTNRHVVADEPGAQVALPGGGRVAAEVVPTSYPGDLVLLRAEGLGAGPFLAPADDPDPEASLYALGADLALGRVRSYAPGRMAVGPAAGQPLARLHHSAESGPGNSGGALVNAAGRLIGIVAAGGGGNEEAIPAGEIAVLRARSGPGHREQSRRLGAAVRACDAALERAGAAGRRLPESLAAALVERCLASGNRQLFDLAGQAMGRAGMLEEAVALFEKSLDQDRHALNARLSLAETLQFARRYAEAAGHLAWLLEVVPENVQVLRLAVVSGKWGGAPELARRAIALLEAHHPRLAASARRFLSSDAPPPPAAAAP